MAKTTTNKTTNPNFTSWRISETKSHLFGAQNRLSKPTVSEQHLLWANHETNMSQLPIPHSMTLLVKDVSTMFQHTTQSVILKTYIITISIHKKDMPGTEKIHLCFPESWTSPHHITHQLWRHFTPHQHLPGEGGNKHHHQIPVHLTLQVPPLNPTTRNNIYTSHLHLMTHQIQVPHPQAHHLHPHITHSRRRREVRKSRKYKPKTRNHQRKRSLIQLKRRWRR